MSNKEQWLLERKVYLGGSEVAPIMGLSPWSTPLDVYREKMNPAVIYEEESEDLKRGVRVEKYILQEYCEVNNCSLETNKSLSNTLIMTFLPSSEDQEAPRCPFPCD